MTEVVNITYKNYLHTERIKNTSITIRYFLLSIGFINLSIFLIFSFFYGYSPLFNLWFFITETLLILYLCITQFQFRTEKYLKDNVDLWIKAICGSVGITLAIGISILYFYLPLQISELVYYQAINFSFIIICVSSIFALTFLTQKKTYFLLFFIPITLPFLYAQFDLAADKHLLFILLTDFVLFLILICSSITVKIHKKLAHTLYKNNVLVRDSERQIELQNCLNKQLCNEMQKSKNIEFKLHEYSQTLEQKIIDRTLDLELMHQNLKKKQTNLLLAHDIAGLTQWDWHIKERQIILNDKLHKTSNSNVNIFNTSNMNHIHPDDIKHYKKALIQNLRGFSDQFEATYRIQSKDKQWCWVHDIGRIIKRNPKNNFALQMIGIRRDIHKERVNQERLKLSASVLRQAAEGIFVLDENLNYIDVNPFYEKITGFNRDQLLGKHIFDIVVKYKEKQQFMHNQIIHQLLSTGKYNDDFTESFLSGQKLAIRVHINSIKDEHNRTTHYIGFVSDLTEKKLQEQRVSYLKNYDSLTNLPNRFYYNYQLHKYLITHKNANKQLAIILLNVDRFRSINEYLTNHGGDKLLKQLAQRLQMCNSDALFLAHLNGDNFAIVYEQSHNCPSIHQHCERITHALSTPFHINNEDHTITISMGISFYPEHGQHIDYLNSCAEQALNKAKSLGGNMTLTYNPQMDTNLDQDACLERDLRHALKRNELVVYYQPKLYFKTLKIQGFEALIRWKHPEKGLIPPDVFLPMAEKTSLISEIGKLVIEQSAKQIQKWQNMGYKDITISLNVVAQQLHRGNLLCFIDQTLAKYQISGKNLELEITESFLVDKSDVVKKTLKAIKKRNISISLDDFGTGYSSLSYLTNFPIDTLKIDRCFISKIGHPQQEAVVSTIIAMGKAMGMTVVAEGVETEEQKSYLANLNCDIAQGFLFSNVLSEQDATMYLIQNNQA